MNALRAVVAVIVRLITGAHAEGPPAPTQAIYFANHASHLDFITVWATLPAERRATLRAVAAADYWGKARLITRVFDLFLVDRGKGGPVSEAPAPAGGPVPVQELRGQTAKLGTVLTAGQSLLIFPEGTRGDGENLAEFQAGLARLARAFPTVPVVPIALIHLSKMLPKGKLVPVPMLATAQFLEPVEMRADETDADYLERARATLMRALRAAAGEHLDTTPEGES